MHRDGRFLVATLRQDAQAGWTDCFGIGSLQSREQGVSVRHLGSDIDL